MTARRVSLLFAIGIIVIALAAWVSSRNPGSGGSVAGTAVLPGLESSLNQVSQVRITKAAGVRTTLERGASDWIVAERGYPADTGKLRQLLLDLGSLKAVERKTRIPANYPVLGVQDVTSPTASGARIDVVTPGKTWSLIIGNTAGSSGSYVRVPGSAQSLLASPQIIVDAGASQWLDPTLIDIARKRVSEIDEHPAKGPAFSVTRAKATDADFTVHGIPRGRELTGADAADTMGSALSNLTLTDVRKAAPPASGTDVSHALFKTFDGLEIDVSGYKGAKHHHIGLTAHAADKAAEPQAQPINARVQGWEYQIPGYRYDEIFQPLQGLLKPLPAKKKVAAAHAHRAK
jgi:hypothetical protein